MNTQGIYGAYIFFLLHHRGDLNKMLRLEKLLDRKNVGADKVWGMSLQVLPEAKRVYLALCKRYEVEPEAANRPI